MENALTEFVREEIRSSLALKEALLQKALIEDIVKISNEIIEAFRNGKKLLIAGNGGSAADAQHLAAEFVGRYNSDRPGLPCIALTTDTSILTAVSNDLGYAQVFVRQIQALGSDGDILLAISTSGSSKNLLEAIKECRNRKIMVIGLTGASGGKMAKLCDYCIAVPSSDTPRIQEAHILIGHIICAIVENSLFS